MMNLWSVLFVRVLLLDALIYNKQLDLLNTVFCASHTINQ